MKRSAMSNRLKIILVAGARPNFIKIASLMRAFAPDSEMEPVLIHTGQHYDETMSELFFEQLGIPSPHVNLGVGSGSHAAQTAAVMRLFEPAILELRPDAVLVVGDVNSTVACGLVAAKMRIPLVHVEAGLRSFDRSMPEEINRVVVDAISDLLFCSEPSGVENLRREGIPEERIFLVGNVMIDTLLQHRERARQSQILKTLGLEARTYATLTLHRPSNVDDPSALQRIVEAVGLIQAERPVIFPAHPRTRKKLAEAGLEERIRGMPHLRLIEPLGYLDFLQVMASSLLVLTDSGGIQEETTVLGVPCLTLRENTERPITLEVGTNHLVGTDPGRIMTTYKDILEGKVRPIKIPPLWDGKAADRIVRILKAKLPLNSG